MNFPFRPPPPGRRAGHAHRGARHARRLWSPRRLPLPRIDLRRPVRSLLETLAAHRRRAFILGLLGIALIALVATTSLPMAIAPFAPNVALFLSPENPYALMELAREDRRRMSTLLRPAGPASEQAAAPAEAAPPGPAAEDAATPPAPSGDGAGGEAPAASPESGSIAAAPADAVPDAAPAADAAPPDDATDADAQDPSNPSRDEDLQRLRGSIRGLAGRALALAPLDAEAYRLLGEMSDTPDAAREAMLAAFARSRREAFATFWLLNQGYEARDFPEVVSKADILLRTAPALNKYTFSYLYSIVPDPDGRRALVEELREDPPWRTAFFQGLGQNVGNADAVELFLAMKEAGSPVAAAELAPYLYTRLFIGKDAEGTYNTWLQLLSDDELNKLLPINNPDFAADPSGIPFDWRINRGRNVTASLVRLPREETARAIRIQFGVGRVRFGGVFQATVLRPGTYSFTAREAGNMSAKRGMKWQVRCFPSNVLAGESSQLFGSPRGWQDFSFQFTVPEQPDCVTQIVRLVHDARSASEEYATGNISFSRIRIAPVSPDKVEAN